MYYTVDENKAKLYLFNHLERGRIENFPELKLKNVKYVFDDNLQLKEIYAITEPAYVITDHGFVKWEPMYIGKKTYIKFKKHENLVEWNDPTKRIIQELSAVLTIYDKYLFVDAAPTCINYICFEQPKTVFQLTKDNFENNIQENHNKLIINFESTPDFVNINVEDKRYSILFVFSDIVVLPKGTCFLIQKDKVTACY